MPRIFGWTFATKRAAPPAEELLSDAVGWWDVASYRAGDRFLRNRGTARDLLDMRLGSSLEANSNDPTYLPVASVGYIYLSGAAASTLTCTAPATATSFSAVPLSGAAPTTGAATGGAAFTFSTAGSWTRVDLLDSTSAVVASFDADKVAGSDTTYTDTFAVAWSFTRPAGNYLRTVVVPNNNNGGAPLMLCGLDDRLEIPIQNTYQHQLLSVRAGEPLTAFVVARCWTVGGGQGFFNKGTNNAAVGNPCWYTRGSAGNWVYALSDGTTGNASTSTGTNVVGAKKLHGFTIANQTIQALTSTVRGAATNAKEATDIYNPGSRFIICGADGGNTSDAEIFAAAIFRRALTNAEIATIATYYGAP